MMPNFLIVGAPRCGTTMLYEGLRKHPEVYMSPIKEPSFFINGGIDKIEDYRALFAAAATEKMLGEASTLYLYSPEAPGRIAQSLPNVKIIAVLRNPVERAYSHFLQHVRENAHQYTDFASTLEAEQRWMQQGRSPFLYYRNLGFYSQQLERYFALFDQAQMRVYLYKDIQAAPQEVFAAVFEFLGVGNTFTVDTSVRYNRSGVPRNRYLHRFVTGPSLVKTLLKPILPAELQRRLLLTLHGRNLTKPPLCDEIRQELLASYRDDILKTQELIGRDLSSWLMS